MQEAQDIPHAATKSLGYQVAQWVKNLRTTHEAWVKSLGQEDSPGGGHSNPFQYSCLENPMDRGAWWAIVHGVSKSRT